MDKIIIEGGKRLSGTIPVSGAKNAALTLLPCALLTEHLAFSLPYRALFAHGMSAESLPSMIDALVVLLVRLHLADFYWGDVSLSNVLFRRSAGGFAAYLVDAETGELRPTLSRQMREYDVQVGCENVFAELMSTARVCSLGQITDTFFEVGGQYRRNV